MRHFVRLGLRGLLLELGGLLLRVQGGIAYHWMLRRQIQRRRKLNRVIG